MLTFFVLVSTIIGANSVDKITFETIYQNPQYRRTNQLGEPCIKFVADTPTGGVIYCKSSNDDLRKCNEITTTGGTEIVCATQLDGDDCNVCAMDRTIETIDQKIQTMDQKMQTMNQKIDELLNKMNNLHISAGTIDGTTDERTDETTDAITYAHMIQFDVIWKVHPEQRLYSKDGEPCLEMIAASTSKNPDEMIIYCKVEGDELRAHSCKRDANTNEIVCHSNLHTTDETPDVKPAETTDAITYLPMVQFDVIWKVHPEQRLYSEDNKPCLETHTEKNPEGIIYCKVEGDESRAHSCKRDANTNEIVCQSQQSSSAAAAVQLRNNDNVNAYKSTNDSGTLQEQLKLSLISMWVVLALIVIGNAIFIWCYMKRNKQRKFDLE